MGFQLRVLASHSNLPKRHGEWGVFVGLGQEVGSVVLQSDSLVQFGKHEKFLRRGGSDMQGITYSRLDLWLKWIAK